MAHPVLVKQSKRSQFDFIAQLRRPNGSEFDFRAVLGSKQGAQNRVDKVKENNPDADFLVLTMRNLKPTDGQEIPEANLPYIEALETVEADPKNQARDKPKSGVIVLRTE